MMNGYEAVGNVWTVARAGERMAIGGGAAGSRLLDRHGEARGGGRVEARGGCFSRDISDLPRVRCSNDGVVVLCAPPCRYNGLPKTCPLDEGKPQSASRSPRTSV
jgi:hypothetical protein